MDQLCLRRIEWWIIMHIQFIYHKTEYPWGPKILKETIKATKEINLGGQASRMAAKCREQGKFKIPWGPARKQRQYQIFQSVREMQHPQGYIFSRVPMTLKLYISTGNDIYFPECWWTASYIYQLPMIYISLRDDDPKGYAWNSLTTTPQSYLWLSECFFLFYWI